MSAAPLDTLPAVPAKSAARRPTARFLFAHPAHLVALGFGAGLSPLAPGTAGTLLAWVSFMVLDRWLGDAQWAGLLAAGFLLGWWACTLTARSLGEADPGAIVWDEVLAFWAVLWLVTPAGWTAQFAAFLLFRFFDAVKPGPVAWADALFKRRPAGCGLPWAQGLGILLDDVVAALCTLLVIALWRF